MIVSHRHGFIFIHCRKVAGSSMKVSLAPHLGPSDVLLGSLHEVLRETSPWTPWVMRQMAGPRGWWELISARAKGRPWQNALNKVVKKRYKSRLGLASSSHPPAADLRRAFPEVWDRYFKFCFVRNPYERAVSDYLYRTRNEAAPPTFTEHLEGLLADARAGKHKHDNWPMYTVNDTVAVDFVGRFENLEEDFREATRRAGLEGVELAGTEKRRSYPKPWRAYYSDGDRERVEALYGDEIRYFGYTFEEDA